MIAFVFRKLVLYPGEYCKASGVDGGGVDAFFKYFQAVELRVLLGGDCGQGCVAPVRNGLGARRGIPGRLGGKFVDADEVSALGQGLGVAYHLLDVRCLRSLYAKQVMLYLVFRHHVYEELSRVCQVKDVAHVSCVTVLHWQRHALHDAVHTGLVCRFEIREGDELRRGVKLARRDISVCARKTAVAHPHAKLQPVLIVPGEFHHLGGEQFVILLYVIVLNIVHRTLEDYLFPFRVSDGKSKFFLYVNDAGRKFHPLFEKGRHLLVYFQDFFPDR